MGNCPFRGKFTPNEDGGVRRDDIPGSSDHEKITFGFTDDFSLDDNKPVAMMIDDVELDGSSATFTNGQREHDFSKEDEMGAVPLIVESARVAPPGRTEGAALGRPCVLLRRGAPFRVMMELNRPHSPLHDTLCLVFAVRDASSPSYSQHTEVSLPVLPEGGEGESPPPPTQWRLTVVESKDKTLVAEVTASSMCIVGEWTLEVDSRSKDDRSAPGFRFKLPEPIIILFNPWCEADAVYLGDEEQLAEYVLADTGLMWRGSHNCPRLCAWSYGQFEENILECCLYLLSGSVGGRLKLVDRADPVCVVRHLSAALQCRDAKRGGVLLWGGGKGGSAFWGGSAPILQKYFRRKKPVRCGQCWVYAGIFTTVCRALGIPCRPVTNYSSGRDTHDGTTVDIFFDGRSGEPLDRFNVDVVWNFHVWNEAWMRRPDLEPGGYGGWQAVDSTPTKDSSGGGCGGFGPASVSAVRRGEVLRPFDTGRIFVEANSRRVHWRHDGPHRPLQLIGVSEEGIGRCISTKAAGKFEREDLTQEYKHAQSSLVKEQEPEALLRALMRCDGAISRYRPNGLIRDVTFELTTPDSLIGDALTVRLKAVDKREKGEEYSVRVSIHVHSTLYTGQGTRQLVKRDEFEIQLGPGVENVMKMSVKYAEYARSLSDAFVVTATAHVLETGFDFCAQEDFTVRMPVITIQVEGEEDIVENRPLSVTVTLPNPLSKPLRTGEFILGGGGFGKTTNMKIKRPVPISGVAKATCSLTPTSPGSRTIVATFKSRELWDVDGYRTILVKSVAEAEGNCHL